MAVEARTYAVCAFGALLLGLLTLTGADDPNKQWATVGEPPTGTSAEFRTKVVREWKWRPNYGVVLTTTEYARKHLEKREYTSGGRGTVQGTLISELNPYKLVLFQTDHLDIVVSKVPTEDIKVAIIERQTGKYLVRALNGGVDRGIRGEFVDVDQSPPFELSYYSWSSGGAGLTLYRYRLFDLRSGLEPMLDIAGRFDLHGCPEAQLKPLRGDVDEKDGRVTVHSRTNLMLKSSPYAHCATAGVEAHQRHDCEFDAERRAYECTVNASKTDTIGLDNVKLGGWQSNAENIRWVLDHSDRLKSLGFRYPDGFLERLPRHLP
jgi:hypothetical protein